MPKATTVLVQLEPAAGATARGDDPSQELLSELAAIDDAEVSRRGTKRGIDVAAIAQLVVTLSGAAGGLGTVVETVRGWLQVRAEARTVRLEIDGDVREVSGVDDAEQQALIDAGLERHRVPA